MVILIATEDTATRTGLEAFLSRHTSHRILQAGTVEEIETVGTEAEDLHVLLCARHFSTTDGQAVQEAMQSKFYGLHTGFLATEEDQTLLLSGHDRLFGGSSTHYDVLNWIHELDKLPPPPPPPARQSSLPESLIGLILGDYKIEEKRRDIGKSESYLALQITMNRRVVLERLKPEFQNDANEKRNFRALVRARANVAHPSIATVYEAQETEEGEIYYTRELVQGKSLADLEQRGETLPQESLIQLLRVAGEAMVFYAERQIPRIRLLPEQLFQGDDGLPRLSNLATTPQDAKADDAADLEILANAIEPVSEIKRGRAAELSTLLRRMRGQGNAPILDWGTLVSACRKTLAHLAEVRTLGTPAVPRPTAHLRKARKRKWLPLCLGGAGLVSVALLAAWIIPSLSKSGPRKVDEMIRIPAGESVFGEGTPTQVAEFWIDKYEVTIAEYASFLAAVGDGISAFDHPEQPKTKTSHKPLYWDEYFPAATEDAYFKGYPISLDTPVLWADWWDAYAYAKWRGRRLPTEQEWEKAGRGPSGYVYPWGNQANEAFANTGADFSATSSGGGTIDGFGSWSDVDEKSEDKSVYGVCGLAGNVAEWTGTWSQHPDLPDQQSPVYRGGSFHQKDAPLASQRWTAKTLDLAQPFIGFRTASDQPPQPTDP